MEPKIIIGAVFAIVLFYFRFGPGSRMLKKKTHHYIVPPASRVDSNSILVEIESKQYDRFILIKNVIDNYLIKGVQEYSALSDYEGLTDQNIKVATYGDWTILKIDPIPSFYDYHNLACWLSGFDESLESPELTIGYSKNTIKSEKDYLFFLDPHNAYGDTQVGAFRSEQTFAIYLPEAYELHGNLTIKKGIKVSFSNKMRSISAKGLDISSIESLNFEEIKTTANNG